jgi:hypothetical protein
VQEAAGEQPMDIHLSQNEIASMAVMSRTAASKVLMYFSQHGWTETGYGRTCLRNPAAPRLLLSEDEN